MTAITSGDAKTAPILTTPRLRLRPMEPGDVDALCVFWCDPENVKFFLRPSTREDVAARIKLNQERYREFGYGRWAVTLPDGELIGDCGLIWQDLGNNISSVSKLDTCSARISGARDMPRKPLERA
jgi:RimJ/RimL family protein N-acetyltransferase